MAFFSGYILSNVDLHNFSQGADPADVSVSSNFDKNKLPRSANIGVIDRHIRFEKFWTPLDNPVVAHECMS